MELKWEYLDELYREKYFDKDVPQVYLKSEADKVIAEKDAVAQTAKALAGTCREIQGGKYDLL